MNFAALAFFREIETMMKESCPTNELTANHEALLEDYLDSLSGERNYSPNTVRGYKTDLESYFFYAYRMNVEPLAPTTRQLRGYLADQDRARYSRKTINRRLSALRTFFRWLNVSNISTSNAISAVQGPKIPKHLPHIFSEAEIDNLFDTLEKDIEIASRMAQINGDTTSEALSMRDDALFEVLYASGARVSEIAGMKLSQIDFSINQVKLFGKGSKERIVPLHQRCVDALRKYVDEGRPLLLDPRKRSQKNDAVFLSRTGNPLSADSIRKIFKSKLEKCGLDTSMSPHAMRHTFATDLLDGGADLRSVQELLGHASLSTTQIYTHLTPERLKAAHSQAHPRA